jgi:superfamily I DNA/RNA helicase
MLRQTKKDLSEVAEKKNDSQRIKFYILNQHLENISILILNIKLNSSKVSELIEKLQELSKQAEEPESIELSTIHKSKGRENDVVYILNENLIPSPFAFTEDQLIQEQNLKYVARTRAKKELYYLNLK